MINNILLICSFFFSFYLLIKSKFIRRWFLDDEFIKIQSFHKKSTPTIGGLMIILNLLVFIVFINSDILNLKILILFGVANFLIGSLDDLRLIRSPIIRFFIIIFLNLIIILIFDFNIKYFGIFFLDYINEFIFFKFFLVLFALFFIINGANLVDGFNGLLGIHAFIILILLKLIMGPVYYDNMELKNYIDALIILVFCFLLLNFPKAKIFLGDGGAYFLGSQISIISILIFNTSNNISPFFIAIILSYLFIELFFSVFRKIFQKKNPFLPDGIHLHMLIFYKINQKYLNANPKTGFLINLGYLIIVLPSLIYFDNNLYCMIHFFLIILIYLSIYYLLKKNII